MSEDTKVEQSSGNVFKDVGFSDAEAERALLKADLAFEIYNIIEGRKLTQAKAGEILGVDPSEFSKLKKGDFHYFSVEQLSTLLNRFNHNIEIRITPISKTKEHLSYNDGRDMINRLNQDYYNNESERDSSYRQRSSFDQQEVA